MEGIALAKEPAMPRGARLTHAPCIGGPYDGRQVRVDQPYFLVTDGDRTYRYLMHRFRGEESTLSFYALDSLPIDHALSYLFRGYRGSDE